MPDDFDKKDETDKEAVRGEVEAAAGSDDEYEKVCFLPYQ